ncbi:Chitinase 1, partial [Scheffersomyces spartinae]
MLAKSLLLCMASAFVAASEVAVYWGQNSAGGQERLSTYCDSTSVDIVLVSFINGFPNLEVNFSNQCGATFPSGLLHCPQIGEDIKYCQSKGKKVMISMGGASGSYGFSSEAEGSEFATTLWNKFGGGSDAERPFDDAVVDGFDFDIEHGAETGYVALAEGLKSYFATASKKYYLGAAPQCPYPDATLNQLLTSVALDYSFIQFYNNYCNLGPNFNWASWAEYAATVSPNKDIQLFLGLPGSEVSASGYTPSATVNKYLSDIQCGPNFGGFAIWDASSAWSNVDSNGDNYAVQLKNLLNEADPCTTSASSSSSATSTKLSTTTAATTSDVLSSSAFYGNVSSSAVPSASE